MSTTARPAVTQRFLDRLYGRIARRYDLLNRVQSIGLDVGIRRVAARAVGSGLVLDMGAGTGDLAAACLKAGAVRVVCLDRSPEMLRAARGKLVSFEKRGRVAFVYGDSSRLPFHGGVFDGVGSAFVFRNIPDVAGGLAEARRVLSPGGRIAVVDVMAPPKGLWGFVYGIYLSIFLPLWGRFFARDVAAYKYLAASIRRCFTADAFAVMVGRAGFRGVVSDRRWRGAAAVVTGTNDG